MSDGAIVVTPSAGVPYATRVLASAKRSAVVVIGPRSDSSVPAARITDLLTGPFGVGAVVARQVEGPRWMSPPSRDVDDTTCTWLAVRSSLLTWADLDPREDEVSRVSAVLLSTARQRGLRVVSEPTWSGAGPASEEGPGICAEATPAAPITRLLVITGTLTDGTTREEDRAARQLIASLNAQCRHSDLTVVAVDRRWSETQAARLRAKGITVVEGPCDWDSWFDQRWGTYSHVFLTQTGLRSAARRWIETTQPQASKVLHFSSLPFREVTALAPITPADELIGLDHVHVAAEARLAEQARWADAVWCEDAQDTSFVTGLLPGKPVVLVPPVIELAPIPTPLIERRGVAVVATEGHDMIGGNEDATLRFLRDLLPGLRLRDPGLECTVITDWPTPMLEAAAASSNAIIAPRGRQLQVIDSARLVVAAHGYGTGGRHTVVAALSSGTPFVATPQAVSGLELGSLAPLAMFGTAEDLIAHGGRLITDDGAWTHFAGAAGNLLATRYSAAGRAVVLRRALAQLGITPGSPAERWPEAPWMPSPKRARKPAAVELRPPGVGDVPPLDGPVETDPAVRYWHWTKRHGATAEVLRSIRADLRHLTYRPKISVLMPVHETPATLLREAVDSLRAQIYENWQLCIADDGSTRPDTLELLRELGSEPSIVVTSLPCQSGISAATNAALAVADGDYVAFVDHDDLLKPHALAQVARWLDADPDLDVVYSDEDKVDDEGNLFEPHIKPDWSPDQLMTHNYVSHLTVARRSLVEALGGMRTAYDGSQDYDLLLRLSEHTDRIGHIPEPLYTWRTAVGSTASHQEAKPFALDAARAALVDAMSRRGYEGSVESTGRVGYFRTRYALPGSPRVSIIIPTRDRADLLRNCIDSVLEKSTYHNFEMIVVDNQSTDGETLAYLADLPGRVLHYPHRFNYARMMNLAARSADCDALLFLNNDTEVITPEWIEALLEHAMRPEVGAVGGRLYFGDGEPQHEGILVGVCGGWALNVNHRGYWIRGELVRNTAAVTGACTMIRPSVYWQLGGNDERLRVAYNDVDLCLRVRQAGYEVVYTPYAELYHHESSTRSGFEHHDDGPLFGIRWHPQERIDPYYSPMFTMDRTFWIKT